MFFFREILNNEITGPCELFKSLIAVIAEIDLIVDSTEAQAVCNDKGIDIVILGKVIIRSFELVDLLWVQDMNLFLVQS